eukprot:CAMPEP_0171344522 /NCGR_PEP_ID=MMETSP0878-20121228/19558_1 /TAXON_ID=67004 /ORGANISM="Thalassiosira weissflogii, Strain CCMP1336" /LENGTH=504 /DNA_ID=CAMNT_0011847727 /DNA_START=168 /DNA_END=1682 /DNA_ORIENTATION=+
MTWWKYLFLSALASLVLLLVRLNYQLMKELGRDGNDALGVQPSVAGKGRDGDTKMTTVRASMEAAAKDAQNLKYLREQVSEMKTKLKDMNTLVEEMKKKKQHRKPGGAKGEGGREGNAKIDSRGQLERLTCDSDMATLQTDRMNKRFAEWWSHSACPDQVWMENISNVFDDATSSSTGEDHGNASPYLILDIGCNKGYTSADFLDALSPGTHMNPHTLVEAIQSIAEEDNTKYDRDCGVCNDCKKPLNSDTSTRRPANVHCFEPSPATYQMLTRAHEKLMPKGDDSNNSKINDNDAKWHIHNVGLHQINGQLSWHKACASAVGDELCTIVPEGTPDAITVPVITVDSFLRENYMSNSKGSNMEMPLVHMLKIDAEGLDPAVITGSRTLLSQNRAVMVMFEFNPGLSEKDPPHGMWGKRGNPKKTLLEVVQELDDLGYDCYLDTRVPREKEKFRGEAVKEAPALYRITGGCLREEPRVRGWANVVCASRRFGGVAEGLSRLSWVG